MNMRLANQNGFLQWEGEKEGRESSGNPNLPAHLSPLLPWTYPLSLTLFATQCSAHSPSLLPGLGGSCSPGSFMQPIHEWMTICKPRPGKCHIFQRRGTHSIELYHLWWPFHTALTHGAFFNAIKTPPICPTSTLVIWIFTYHNIHKHAQWGHTNILKFILILKAKPSAEKVSNLGLAQPVLMFLYLPQVGDCA